MPTQSSQAINEAGGKWDKLPLVTPYAHAPMSTTDFINSEEAFDDDFWGKTRVLALKGQQRVKVLRQLSKKPVPMTVVDPSTALQKDRFDDGDTESPVSSHPGDELEREIQADSQDDYHILDDAFIESEDEYEYDDEDGSPGPEIGASGGGGGSGSGLKNPPSHPLATGGEGMPGQEYLRRRPKKKERYVTRAEALLQRKRKQELMEEQERQNSQYSQRLTAAVFCRRHQQHISFLIINAAGVGRLILARLDLSRLNPPRHHQGSKSIASRSSISWNSLSLNVNEAESDTQSSEEIFRSLESLAQQSRQNRQIEEQQLAAAEAAALEAATNPASRTTRTAGSILGTHAQTFTLSLTQLAARSVSGIIAQCTITAEATMCHKCAPQAPAPIVKHITAAKWFVLAHGGDVAAFSDENLERVWSADVYTAVSQPSTGSGGVSNKFDPQSLNAFAPARNNTTSVYEHRITAFTALPDALMFLVGTASGCIVRLDIRKKLTTTSAGGQRGSVTRLLTVTPTVMLRLTHTILRQSMSLVDLVALGAAHRSVLCDDLSYDPSLLNMAAAATNGTQTFSSRTDADKASSSLMPNTLGWSWEGDGDPPAGIDALDAHEPEKVGLYGRTIIPETTGGDERLPFLLHRGVAALRGYVGGLGSNFIQGVSVSAATLQSQIRSYLRSTTGYGSLAGTGFAHSHARSKSRAIPALSASDIAALTDTSGNSSSVTDNVILNGMPNRPLSPSNETSENMSPRQFDTNEKPESPSGPDLSSVTCAVPGMKNPLALVLPSVSDLKTNANYLVSGSSLVTPRYRSSSPSGSPAKGASRSLQQGDTQTKQPSVFVFPSPKSTTTSLSRPDQNKPPSGNNRAGLSPHLLSAISPSPFALAIAASSSSLDPGVCELDTETNAWAVRGPVCVTCVALFEPSPSSAIVRRFGLASLAQDMTDPSYLALPTSRSARMEPVLVIGLADGTVRLYAGATFRELMFILDPKTVGLVRIMRPIVSVVPAEGGSILYTLDAAGLIRTWDLEQQVLVGVTQMSEPQRIIELQLFPTEQSLVPDLGSPGKLVEAGNEPVARNDLLLLNHGSWLQLSLQKIS